MLEVKEEVRRGGGVEVVVLDALDDVVARVSELFDLVDDAVVQLDLLFGVEFLEEAQHDLVGVPVAGLGRRDRMAAWLLWRGQGRSLGRAFHYFHLVVVGFLAGLRQFWRALTLNINRYVLLLSIKMLWVLARALFLEELLYGDVGVALIVVFDLEVMVGVLCDYITAARVVLWRSVGLYELRGIVHHHFARALARIYVGLLVLVERHPLLLLLILDHVFQALQFALLRLIAMSLLLLSLLLQLLQYLLLFLVELDIFLIVLQEVDHLRVGVDLSLLELLGVVAVDFAVIIAICHL